MILITLAAVGHILVKVSVCLIGAAALYCACFLYEDEEGKLRDRIEQIWISIDERRRSGEPLALTTATAGLLNRALDKLLGQKLLSVQMIGISTCLSVTGFALHEVYDTLKDWITVHTLFWDSDDYLTVALIPLSAIAIILATRRNKRTISRYSLLAPVVYFVAVILYTRRELAGIVRGTLTETPFVLIASFVSDVAFLFCLRASLKKLVSSPTIGWLITTVAVQLGIALGVAVGPFMASDWLGTQHFITIGDIAFGLAILNIPTAVFAASFTFLLAGLCLHRAVGTYFWPTVSRLFYPIARFKIVTNRKVLVGISVACVIFVYPPFAELLKKASEWFK